ncbi:MAG: hypothetical protein CBD27_10640 [Rhodospirillaceae bacterium TMED167]|nr:hypothetical protein [Rhodospirillaceae bacterium]OUW24840.1 MAG: hypothetical protein CBD27_10640 [Rhodospirillaceae bacterium TMED167]
MGKVALLSSVHFIGTLAQGSYYLGWLRRCLSLLAISVFLGACTLDPQTLKSVSRDVPKDALADLSRDADAKQVGGGTVGQEVAALEIDLTNFEERLATLNGAEVIELIGPPEFERSEPPARIWQYRSPVCVVYLFLYDDDGTFAVEHVDLRPREAGLDHVNQRLCYASIIQKLAQKTGGADLGERGARDPDTGNLRNGPASSGVRQEGELTVPELPVPERRFDQLPDQDISRDNR